MSSPEKLNVLFIPGMSCTKDIWDALELLPEEFSCTFLDWPLELTPAFHSLDDCAQWLSTEILKTHPDIFIGHSLGGLALLKAQELGLIPQKKTILIETFLLPPPTFFRNFIGPYASKELEGKLHEMFNHHRPFFSEKLRLFLREESGGPFVDLKKITHAHFFYGMRGEESPQKIFELLPALQDLNDTNSISLLPYSGHFPMIEEPVELEEELMTLLTQ